MSEETDFQYGDYDLEGVDEADVVPASEALPYYDVPTQDDTDAEGESKVVAFVNAFGVSPKEAIATANHWRITKVFFGVGQCLRTVRQFYDVPAKYGTAAESWQAAEHKHFATDGVDCPRGAPVWWTGGSSGAGHIALSVGGGTCITTDWKFPGRLSYAKIDDITNQWNLSFKGYTREINDVVVWRPAPVGELVHLSNLLPGKRSDDVLKVKKRLYEKGYRGFVKSSNKYGRGIRKAYAAYQHRLGYSGDAANGVPGEVSLKKLGFRVAE